MAHGYLAPCSERPVFSGDYRFLSLRAIRRAGEGRDIGETFDVEADSSGCGHPVPRPQHVVPCQCRLVADGKDAGGGRARRVM